MPTAPPWVASKITAFGASGTSRSALTPSATASGHYVVAQVFVLHASETITGPAGWEKFGQASVAGEVSMAWFGSFVTEAGEKSFSFSWGTAAENAVILSNFKEVNATTPVGAFALKENTTSEKPMKFASISPTMTNTLSLLMSGSGGAITPPAGWTQRATEIGLWLATAELAASGASGEKVATAAESGQTATMHVALNPVSEVKTSQGKASGTATGGGTASGAAIPNPTRQGHASGTAAGAGTAKGAAVAFPRGKAAGAATGAGTAKGIAVGAPKTSQGKGAGTATGAGIAKGVALPAGAPTQGHAAGAATATGTAKGRVIHSGRAVGHATGSGAAVGSAIAAPVEIRLEQPSIFPTGTPVALFRDPHIGDLLDLGYGTVPVPRFLGNAVGEGVVGEDETVTFTEIEREADYLAYGVVGGEQRLVRLRLSRSA